jgi:phosphoenolpyruvate carboxykinase (ATP)
VNTGWTGGPYGIGSRMPIKATRAILETLLSGELDNTEFRKDYNFGFTVPMAIKGVDRSLLNPRDNWKNSVEYDKAAVKLVKLFEENFAQHFTLRKQKDEAVFPN